MNLASRLEGQCKVYGVDIIVREDTSLAAPGFAVLELDLIRVKGKKQSSRIYALVGPERTALSVAFGELRTHQHRFLDSYRRGDIAQACGTIPACRRAAEALGWRQGYYDAMEKRLTAVEATRRPAAWDGVYVAQEK